MRWLALLLSAAALVAACSSDDDAASGASGTTSSGGSSSSSGDGGSSGSRGDGGSSGSSGDGGSNPDGGPLSDAGGDAGVTVPVYGARLPVSYDLASLPGTVRYVAPSGVDATGDGSVGAPYATVAKAYAASKAGDSIVVRGGTYREGNLVVGKSLTIVAYPGEIPVFVGARAVSGGFTADGADRYIAYEAQPVTNGSGICFTTGPGCATGGQNLSASQIGKNPDQAWIGATQLVQVPTRGELTAGKFWVDAASSRLYLVAADADKPGIEVSDRNVFARLTAPNTTLRGLRVTRFSNTASDYGVVTAVATADDSLLEDVEVSDSAFIAIAYQGGADLNERATLRHVSVLGSNWMGVSATYTDDLTLDAVDLSNMNRFDEFTASPQSGGLKTSRTRRTRVLNSQVSNNHSQGLWFDQSNQTVDVVRCRIVDNTGSGLFYEISDDLVVADTYLRATGGARALKLAGSSGLKLVNNTVVGGADPVGIFTDIRSAPTCADPGQPVCPESFGSDRDTVRPHPATLDWLPRLDLLLDNIIAYPTQAGFCGAATGLCVTVKNGTTTVSLESILHGAEPGRGIPATRIDGNVYANGSGTVIATPTKYATVSAFALASAGPPVNLAGFEAAGRQGDAWVGTDGTPSATLPHGEAVATPVDARLNAYVPAGTRHFGVLSR